MKFLKNTLVAAGLLTIFGALIAAGTSVESLTAIKGTHVLVEPTASQFYSANPPPPDATETARATKAENITNTALGYAYRDWVQLFNDEVDKRLIRQTAGATSQNVFSSRNDTTASYVRSTVNFAKDVDFTSVSVWNSGGDSRQTATLLSPRHVLLANHYFPAHGTQLRWVGTNGTVVTRTLVNSLQIGVSDMRIGVLDNDVPLGTISFAPVLSVAAEAKLVGNPIVYFDQNESLFVANVTTVNSAFLGAYAAPSGPRAPFWKAPVAGDSSHPFFALVDGRAAVLGCLYVSFGGPSVSQSISAINTAMTTLGGSYQLTVLPAPMLPAATSGAQIAAALEATPLYPVFNIPMGGGYSDFEVKGSVQNFAGNSMVYIFSSAVNTQSTDPTWDASPKIFLTMPPGDSRPWKAANPAIPLYGQLGGGTPTGAAFVSSANYPSLSGVWSPTGTTNAGKPVYQMTKDGTTYTMLYNSTGSFWSVSLTGGNSVSTLSTTANYPWLATWTAGVSVSAQTSPAHIVNQIVFIPSKQFTKGDTHLVWSYVRINAVGPETDPNGFVIFQPIVPSDWRTAPISP